MRVCLACEHKVDQPDWSCGHCGFRPQSQNGFPLFSPELAESCTGFDPELFGQLAAMEANHFWYRARNQLIQWAFRTYFPQAQNFLEVGCGTGYVLSGLQQAFPQLTLYGSEVFPQGLHFAAQRLPDVALWQMDARQLPFEDEFDVIGAFDVLEHIEEDETVLATRQGGGLLLTVPQHPSLWSQTDVRAHHVRRYVASDLKAKVERSGYQVLRTTSFVSLLLPPMWLSRLINTQNDEKLDIDPEFRINPILNRVFEAVMHTESALITKGVSFPAGGSLLLAAQAK
jgi:SAM-dependent methyltransferase